EWNKNERIEKYADICGISAAHFYNCFRESFGKSPVEYRNSLRLSNAETMLKSTDMRIGEIAQAVGYEDPFYFCRVFTKKNGLSPKKYREKFSRDI
ncbi:MAG: helix-turn-helix transcriptional regulator, partial [Clostridia bacterium]|nr:helix-turn-helix transcriptional regulator [Clostridia bacterium]